MAGLLAGRPQVDKPQQTGELRPMWPSAEGGEAVSIKHKAKRVWHVFRSAVTGRWVTKRQARRHPKTTIEETYSED